MGCMLAPFLLFRDRLPLVFPRRIDAREEDLGRGCGSRARGNGCSASLAFLHGRASERVGEADRRCNRFPGHYSGGLAADCGPLPSREPSPRAPSHPRFARSSPSPPRPPVAWRRPFAVCGENTVELTIDTEQNVKARTLHRRCIGAPY